VVTTATVDAFLDLVLSDDDLMRAEFDALVAATWDAPPPPPPARPAPGDRPPAWPSSPAPAPTGPVDRRPPIRRITRQRSPPG
jgi:hypothetical protein